MGGYAFYIWGSYLITLIAIGAEVFFVWRRKQSLKAANLAFLESNRDEKTS